MVVINHLCTSKGIDTVFLDRDGVVNEKMPEGLYVRSFSDFRILPGVLEAISKLNRAGIRVFMVSNQRGVALGLIAAEFVDEVHRFLQENLKSHGAHLDGVYFCPHDKNSCTCRKPLPGLFQQAAKDFPDIKTETSIMIGDSLSDIEFGNRLGMRTIWIEGHPELRKPGWELAERLADFTCSSLSEAVAALLHRGSSQIL